MTLFIVRELEMEQKLTGMRAHMEMILVKHSF